MCMLPQKEFASHAPARSPTSRSKRSLHLSINGLSSYSSFLFDRIHNCAKHQQQKDGRTCIGRTLSSNSDPSVWKSQLWTHVGDSHHDKSCLVTFSFQTGTDLRGHKRYGSLETHNQEIHHTSLVDHNGRPLLHAYLKFWEGSTNSIQLKEITRF